MKQIILILLFIFTFQKKIHTDPPKDQHHKRGSSYELLFPKTKCDPGYEKKCRVIGMYVKTHNLPQRCFCYEIKSAKTRNLKEVSTTGDKTIKDKPIKDKPIKDKPIRDMPTKYLPFRGKIEKVVKDDHHCKKGEYFVVVSYPIQKKSKSFCTKHPYSVLKL